MSPSFHTMFNYYLSKILLFSNLDFSLKSLTSEFFFFVGIIFLNTIFKNTSRSKFLKINGLFYILTSVLLMLFIYLIQNNPGDPAIGFILVYTGFHSLFSEIFSLPIVGIFLEICPENLEGFFMSLIFFMNNLSKNISTFLGTLCIFVLKIDSNNLNHLNWMITIHFSVSFVGLLILCLSHIPERKKIQQKGAIDAFENSYLAYINSKDSIILEDDLDYERPKSKVIKLEITNLQNSTEAVNNADNDKKLYPHSSRLESDSIK
jgi:hypothetical protein